MTTTAKAKEVKPVVEHLIAVAKKNDIAARRTMLAFFFDENATKKMFDELVPRYKDLNSGFIKSYKVGPRLGDGAEQTILELRKLETKTAKESDGKENLKAKKDGDSGKTTESRSEKAGSNKAKK